MPPITRNRQFPSVGKLFAATSISVAARLGDEPAGAFANGPHNTGDTNKSKRESRRTTRNQANRKSYMKAPGGSHAGERFF
jgi:hypothetical protein